MKWYKIIIPPTMDNEPTSLLNAFDDLFIAAAEPKHTALFSSETSENTYYVCATKHSIGYIQMLIESYNASECHKPNEKLTIMAGKAATFD